MQVLAEHAQSKAGLVYFREKENAEPREQLD